MKKSDNTRSHSWWWDSHINPKNSKWLQENLSEMDSKVSAILKIVEADADSFAQRAEMFYKKRPELINLVEEFYRTYRALVERYTYLAREIRQNIAPDLQAQLGVSSQSAQNSPVDLLSKRSLDGPDIISPSYSYTGASELDCDSPVSEVSVKLVHTDDEVSPLGSRTNNERRSFACKMRHSNMDESIKVSESGDLHDTGDVDIKQLQKELARLQDENKILANKSIEDVAALRSLQLEFSSLQLKMRGLEAEDKVTKNRLKSFQEKEQKLEAENLKLSCSLMSSKEEKTKTLEQQNKAIEDGKIAGQNIQLLEGQMVAIKQELVTAQSQLLEREEDLTRGEQTLQTLQKALASLEEERLKDSFLIEILEQQNKDLHKKIAELEDTNTGLKEETLAQAAEVQSLQHQLTDVMNGTKVLEQLLIDSKQEMEISELAKSVATLKVKELQKELEGAQSERRNLSKQMLQQAGDMARLKETISKREEESVRAQVENTECAMYVLKLEEDIKEGQSAAQTFQESYQQCEDRCKTLELNLAQSKGKLLSSFEEIAQYQDQITRFENMVASADLQVQELQKSVSSLVVEKASMMKELEKMLEHAKVAEGQCAQMHEVVKDKQEEIEMLKHKLINQLADNKRQEENILKEKATLVEREAEILLAHQQLENEQIQLKQQLNLKITLSEYLENKISSLEIEKSNLVLQSQQMQQKLLDLCEENTVLSSHCLNSKADLQAAETAVRKAQEDLALFVSEVEKLRGDGCAKAELIDKLRSDVELTETYVAKSREENNFLREEIEKCTKKLADFEAQLNDQKTSLSKSATVNATLAEQVSEKEKSIEVLNQELSEAQKEIIAMNEDIAWSTSHALGLQEQINSLKEQVKLLYTQLHEISEAKQSLEALVEGLQQKDFEAKETNQILVYEQQKLLNDVLVLQEKNKNFEARLSCLTAEKAVLLEEARTHSKQCNSLKQSITSLESDNEALQIQNASLQDQLMNFEEEKKVMEEEKKSFSRKLFEAEGRVQDLQLKVSSLLCEEAALAEQLSERIGKIQILEAAFFDLQEDNTTLSEEVGFLQQQVSALKTREASLFLEMYESSEMINSLRMEIEGLHKEALEAEESMKSFALEQKKNLDECLAMRQKIEDLQMDLGLLAANKVIFTREIATHIGWRHELDGKVKKLEAERCSLQQQLLVAQHMENQLQEDVKNLLEERKQQSDVLGLQNKLEKQEEDLQSLQLELSSTRKEHLSMMDKLNLLAKEKVALLQELKEREQEAGRAKDNFLKLETDFSQLRQVKGTTETELGNKIEEVRRLQEDALILQTAKLELEQKLELSSRQVAAQAEEVGTLQDMLVLDQQEKATLESQLVDAERRLVVIREECDDLKWGIHSLTLELTAVFAIKKKLEEELEEVQKGNKACTQKFKKMQQDLISLQEQKRQSVLKLEAAILEGRKNETRLLNLQEQLNSAESSKLELAEKQSKMSLDWGAAERMLLEEIATLKSASLQKKEHLTLQDDRVIKLEDEIGNLQAEREALQNGKALSVNQMEYQQLIDRLKNELLEKQEDTLNLSGQVNNLQQSLLSTERECEDLRQLPLKDKEDHSAAERALRDELCLVQNEVASKGAQIIELHGTLSALGRHNKMLSEGMSLKENMNAELQKDKEELTQKLQSSGAQLEQVNTNLKLLETELHDLHERLCTLQNENKSNEACFQAQAQEHTLFKEQIEELTGALSNLQSENTMLKVKLADNSSGFEVSDLNRQCQQEDEIFEESATNLDLLQQELAGAREENVKLNELVLDGARSTKKLQEQVSSLTQSKQGLEGTLHLLQDQLKDSRMLLNNAEKAKEAALHELQRHSQKLLQMMSKIEELDKMLYISLSSKMALIRQEAIMLQEDCSENSLKQPISRLESAKQSFLSEAIYEAPQAGSEPFSSPEDDCLQGQSPLPGEPLMIREPNAPGFERNQKSLFDTDVDGVDRLEEKILLLLKEDNSSEGHSVAALVEHTTLESSVEEQLSHLQQEFEHVNLEVFLYKKDINHLKSMIQGNQLQDEGEVAHADVKRLQTMLYTLQENFEEKSRTLQREVGMEKMEKRCLQLMLSEFQDEGLTCASLLRENLLLSGKGVKLIVEEWNKNSGRHQITECINKLIKLEKSCTSPDMEGDENLTRSNGESLLAGVKETSPKPEILQPSAGNTVVIKQLQKRAQEAILLREAVEDMLSSPDGWDHCKEEQASVFSSRITEESKHNTTMDKQHQDLLLSWEPSQWYSSEHDSEHNNEEVDSSFDQRHERDDEIVEKGSLEQQAEQIESTEDLTRLQIKLGKRLHQALMDEKPEHELEELKEERKKLEEELQAHAEQVKRMEAELEKLQIFLKEGSKEGELQDPRQQQQYLRHKTRAEKRARKLSKKLVLRRQQVGNMRDVVAAWEEQQQLATKILEAQVLPLVEKENAPTMEGWDAEQVNKMMEEMQNRKVPMQRHSMDLHMAGQKLQGASSTEGTIGKEEVVQGRINEEGTSVNAPATTKKLSRFGLTWLPLLFATERRVLFKRSTPSITIKPPKPITSHHRSHTNTNTALQTFVSQTRKMGCCACVTSSHQLMSSNDK